MIGMLVSNMPERVRKIAVEGSDDCVATGEANTVLSALDNAIPKAEQQLRRLKEKKTGHRAIGHKHIDPMVAEDN